MTIVPDPSKLDIHPLKLATWLSETAVGLIIIGVVAIAIDHKMQHSPRFQWYQKWTKGGTPNVNWNQTLTPTPTPTAKPVTNDYGVNDNGHGHLTFVKPH